MHFLRVILLLIVTFYADTSFAKFNELQYRFIDLKDGYTFMGKFFVKANDKCLIDIIYNPIHLKDILKNKCIIDIIGSDKNSYDVKYTYKNPFVEVKSTYRKVLRLSEKKVVFEMIANEQSNTFLPRILSSTGSYQVTQETHGCWVEYYQECKIERNNIRGIFILFAKREAVNFLRDLKEYIERTCH
jgi:hypothetical protein